MAAEAGDNYKMVDMEIIPVSARGQDVRLIDGPGQGWFQNNINNGGTHNYRKDIGPDEFRFAVIENGEVVMLANGDWFTVGNTFLRVVHPDGYTADYLYTIDENGHFNHISHQGYERGDFRMFQLYSNTAGEFPSTCFNDSCSDEIPKGEPLPIYADKVGGQLTFVPAPCPTGGCD